MSALRTDLVGAGTVLRIRVSEVKGNVLTSEALANLDATLAAHSHDPHLKLVVLESAGRNFSFGASVEEHRREHVRSMLRRFHDVVCRLLAYPIPTLALVQGKCLGGAFELVLACNFVIAADDAVFACPEIALGVFPPVLAALGPSRLGGAWTDRLVLTGSELDAQTAERIGLVTERASTDTDLLEHAMEWYAENIEPRSAFALRQALEATRRGSRVLEHMPDVLMELEGLYLDRVVTSADGNEGIEAFLAKRAPRWVDA